ncbi:hypothetical protein [Paraliobacillus sediminis]|uniref:hypothetical protein n=1 Tax=Paraliobacillus sediminis TaxID=1885916 RepID=UPI000E3E6EA4|nr:hypothetical protein [Paraliobacillus sediminis]
MFKVEKNSTRKELIVTVGGFFKEEEGESFLADYNENVKGIVPSSYKLIVDSTDLAASKKDMLPILEACFKLYMSNGFKNIVMINPSSVISKGQMHKLAKVSSFEGVFVDSLAEAKEI